MAGWLDILTAPARAMTAQPKPLPKSLGLLGDLIEATDPVRAFGGYGNMMAMALPPGKVNMPPMTKGWTVKTTREHPMMGTREVSLYNKKGEWVGSRSAARGTDAQILAEWGQPRAPIHKKPSRPDPLSITDTPTNAPEVAWLSRDLQDSGQVSPQSIMKDYGRGKGTIRQGYVNLGGLPKERMGGGKSQYDWSELSSGRGAAPPIKIRINENGTTSILDGNHRISYWREQGFDEAPAWIIDERKPKVALPPGKVNMPPSYAKPHQLVVAREMANGKIVYGKPGQIHADLLKGPNDLHYKAKMGYAVPGGKFMTREQAAQYVKKLDNTAWTDAQTAQNAKRHMGLEAIYLPNALD